MDCTPFLTGTSFYLAQICLLLGAPLTNLANGLGFHQSIVSHTFNTMVDLPYKVFETMKDVPFCRAKPLVLKKFASCIPANDVCVASLKSQ